MWGTIANLKENLNKIALDVHFDDEDDGVGIPPYGSPARGDSPPVSDRRNSYGHNRARSIPRSPASNGTSTTDPPYASEIEQYKAEIKRLQASEAEIKALSINYAALLKEKEDQIIRLNKENGSLKQNMEATSPASANGTYKVKDQSSNRQHRITTQTKNRYAINNGTMPSLDSDAVQSPMVSNLTSQAKDKMYECLLGASRFGRGKK